MNRVGRLFICIVGGVALSVTARGDVTPVTPNAKGFPPTYNTNAMNRIMMMKKHHHVNLPPNFPQFPAATASQPGLPQTKAPQSNSRQPYNNISATDFHPKTPTAVPVAPAAAAAPSDSGNPYQSIVTRNVFGLNPIPVATPVTTPQGPPPPKITLTGIMTIFGPTEALFKVAGVVREHGQPHDESYIFTEGEAQDDVEVTKIDTNKMMVTFMNHGVQQDIGLTEGTASSGSAPSAPTYPGQPRMRKFGRFGAVGGNPGGFQNYGSSYGGGNNNGSQNGNNPFGSPNGQQPNLHNNSYVSPAISQLSDEDQSALVSAAHAQAVQNGDPTAAIFPPTKFDPEAGVPPPGDAVPNPSGAPSSSPGNYTGNYRR